MNRFTFFFLLLIAAISLALMPRQLYLGDPNAARYEAWSLITTGSLAVPPTVAIESGATGQYFFFNRARDSYYSKYGILNTVFSLAPLAIVRAAGAESIAAKPYLTIFLFNVFNTILTVLLAAALLQLAQSIDVEKPAAALYVLCVFFSTFLWNYLRAQSSEILQVTLFTYAYLFIVRARHCNQAKRQKLLALAMTCLMLLVMTKLAYAVLLPIWITAAFAIIVPHLDENRQRALRQLAAIALPVIAGTLLIAAVNTYKFGLPWSTGYTQWEANRDLFGGSLAEGLRMYLLGRPRNIFIHFPVWTLSLPLVWRFAARNRFELIVAYSAFIIMLLLNSSFIDAGGSWGYGPRYMLFVMPVLALPFALLLESFNSAPRGFLKPLMCSVITACLLWSAWLQIQVNSINFFALQETRSVLAHFELDQVPAVRDYFNKRHYGLIYRDLRHFKHGADWQPLELLSRQYPPELAEALAPILKKRVHGNYFWLDR